MTAKPAFPFRLLSLTAGLVLGLTVVAGDPPAPPKNDSPAQPPKATSAKDSDKKDKFELVIPGQIVAADPLDKVRGVPCKVHAVKLTKDVSYVIDMVSMDFDSFLRLEDSANTQLAQDDDGGGNLNSRIRFTAAKDDTYLIYAEALGGGQEGQYTLSIRSVVTTPVKTIPLPAPTAKKASELTGELALTDPPGPYRERPAKQLTVDLKAGKKYVVDLMSQQFDCYLMLQDSNGATIAQDDDGGEGLNSRIQFQPNADGRFRLIATTFNGQVGTFTIRVAEE